MSNNVTVSYPWAMILFLIFLVLKLTDNIGWSWWWVTSPLWIVIALMIVFTVLAAWVSS